MVMGVEGIPGETGVVKGCESRIPFKLLGLKKVVIVYAVNASGQLVDRREIVRDVELWKHVCQVVGLTRTWLESEIGFMVQLVQSVSSCEGECGTVSEDMREYVCEDDIEVATDFVCDNDHVKSVTFCDEDEKEVLYDEAIEEQYFLCDDIDGIESCQYNTRIGSSKAVFSDELDSQFADLLEDGDRVVGVRYVGEKSDVIPGQYRFVEASNHRQPVNFMQVSDAEASARLCSKICLQPDELYVSIDGDLDNDELNENILDELNENNVEVNIQKSDAELPEKDYNELLHYRRDHMIRTLIKSLHIFRL